MKKYIFCIISIFALYACTNDVESWKNVLDVPQPIASNVTSTTATITWDAIVTATEYTCVLNDGTEVNVNTASYELKNLESEKEYVFKVYARRTNSLYFENSDVATISFTTTSKPVVYLVASFGDDWDKWYYDYNTNGTPSHVYRLNTDGSIEREWNFAYNGNILTISGKNDYTITLNTAGYADKFVDGSSTYKYTYD